MEKILDVFELYADSDESKVKKFNSKISSKMNVKIESESPRLEIKWVEMMEDTLVYLENILHKPTRLIINEEEVVNIEKIKKVTVESIKHLSKNASFIDDVTEKGDVQPGKLLNVFKEETFNTYENRFIYTLILKMLAIIKKEKEKYLKASNASTKETKNMNYEASSYSGKNKVDIQVVLTTHTENSAKTDEYKEFVERLIILEKNVFALTLTETFQALEKGKVQLVTPPLKKNNVILKNVNFQYAAKLWDFLITEMDKKNKDDNNIQTNAKEYKERGLSKKYMDQSFLLDYLVLDSVESPYLKKQHKKEIIEHLIANVIEKSLDVNQALTEEQLKEIVARQFTVIKYKKQLSDKQIQEIFKKYITKYVQKISTVKIN